MISFLAALPWYLKVAAGVILIVIAFFLFGQIRSCGYDKARKEYEALEVQNKAERDKLVGQIQERDKEIAALESQKEQYKTLAEQGIKLDKEHAKQIEEITSQEAKDLEAARKDMDCRDRARATVELLRTAKPPINLNLDAVIRKQCSG